jgi:hypothetical protein
MPLSAKPLRWSLDAAPKPLEVPLSAKPLRCSLVGSIGQTLEMPSIYSCWPSPWDAPCCPCRPSPGGASTCHCWPSPGGASTCHCWPSPGGASTCHCWPSPAWRCPCQPCCPCRPSPCGTHTRLVAPVGKDPSSQGAIPLMPLLLLYAVLLLLLPPLRLWSEGADGGEEAWLGHSAHSQIV